MNCHFETALRLRRKRTLTSFLFLLVSMFSFSLAPILSLASYGNEGQSSSEEVEELIVLSGQRRAGLRMRSEEKSTPCKMQVFAERVTCGIPPLRAIVGHRLANDLRAPCRC